MSESSIVCKGLSKTYVTASGGIEALRSVDLELAGGQVVALVGASGSGKSTLLRLLAGLDRPTSGQLRVGDADLVGASPAELRRHRRDRVTYVSQKPADNLIPHLTLAEQAADAGAHAVSLLADVGLTHRLGSRAIELSGGEQARAAFALALARGTPLILIDEPTAELDRSSAEPLLAAIARHATRGITCVIATHDPDVGLIAGEMIRLERGQIVDAEVAPRLLPGKRAQHEPGAAVLEASELTKTFNRGKETIHAVERSNLVVRESELAVVLGRSGSGKSTLLTLLAGWQPPDAGSITWRGHAVDPATLAWGELSYMPQRFGLIPELTARENVALPLTLAGKEDRERIDALLETLGLSELADRVPTETSIGQQQRTAIARALVLRPRVLLADEPSSHQDAGWHDAVWRTLLDATADGTACLAATHEEEAAQLAEITWHMDGGILS